MCVTRMSRTRRALLAVLAGVALGAWAFAQDAVVAAQLEYQQSRRAAYHEARRAAGLPGSALPPGDYAWTMDFRCASPQACLEAFGADLLRDGEESFTFVAHLTSDGTRMTYRGAAVVRGSGDAAAGGGCPEVGAGSSAAGRAVCVMATNGEAFVLRATTHPLEPLAGMPLVWVTGPDLRDLVGAGTIGACECGGPGGMATPTVALPGTVHADYYANGRRLPPGVELTVQLVKLP